MRNISTLYPRTFILFTAAGICKHPDIDIDRSVRRFKRRVNKHPRNSSLNEHIPAKHIIL